MPVHRRLAQFVLAVFSIFSLAAPSAHAGLVGTGEVLQSQQADQTRSRLQTMLERDDVTAQLEAWGVDPAKAQERVAHMTDAEVKQLASQMEELPAGGDVLGAAVFLFLVLLVTDILGFTDIFPFVKKTVN